MAFLFDLRYPPDVSDLGVGLRCRSLLGGHGELRQCGCWCRRAPSGCSTTPACKQLGCVVRVLLLWADGAAGPVPGMDSRGGDRCCRGRHTSRCPADLWLAQRTGMQALAALGFQAAWAVVLLFACHGVLRLANRRVVVHGG
ncbi:MAG: hypothetical protein WKF82_01095 [Nocardioidaceae bacterium]